MKSRRQKKENKENNYKLIYVSIISLFALLGITFFAANNSYLIGYTIKDIEEDFIVKETKTPRILNSQVNEDQQGNKFLSLDLFDNNAVNKVVVIYSVKLEDETEKLYSISSTKTNQLLKFVQLTPAGSYYSARIPITTAVQGSRLFVVVSDYDNNRENKLLVVE